MLLLLSCAEDLAAYAEALDLRSSDPPRAAALCERAPQSYRADCLVAVAGTWAEGDPDAGVKLCESVPRGIWREECLFGVAESAYASEGGASAAARCRFAGRFASDCLDHIWTEHATDLLRLEPDPMDAIVRYDAALEWSRSVTIDNPRGVFWEAFFRAVQKPGTRRDVNAMVHMAWCGGMEEGLEPICSQAVLVHAEICPLTEAGRPLRSAHPGGPRGGSR